MPKQEGSARIKNMQQSFGGYGRLLHALNPRTAFLFQYFDTVSSLRGGSRIGETGVRKHETPPPPP